MIPSQSFIPASPDLCIEQFINQTNKPVFLTGKAGTGKTTLLKKLISETHKNAVVVAPTGIAALNAGGVTIHSFFQLPFAGFIPTFDAPPYPESCRIETKETLVRHHSMNKRRLQMLRNLELLVID
jgi:excinuclease UvrABC helicase subunit UvrB